jgi:peptide/nickel transport system substrate-binding protein
MSTASRFRSFRAVTVAVAVATGLLAACSSSSSKSPGTATSEGTGGTPVSGGSLTFGLEAESPGYVPGISSMLSYSGGAVERALYDPLTIYAPNGSGQPFLAQSVTPNSTYTQWTVTLRPNVVFDDGSALTAQDVADDFTQYYNAKGSSSAGTFSEVTGVTASGPLTAVFNLNTADANFPVLLTTFFAFNPDVRAKYGANFAAHPDGTGPFELVSWQQNSQLVLKANPNYWGRDAKGNKLPYLANLTLKIIVSGATRNDALQSGQIQGYQSIEGPILAQAEKLPNVKVLVGQTGGYGWFLNTAAPPTNDVRVRLALAYATDRNAILAAQGAGDIETTVDQYFPQGSPYYSAKLAAQFPSLDLAKAKALVQQYINDPKRSDGKSVGSPLSVQLNYLAGDPQSGAAVQLAQQQWKAAGIQVTLNSFDEATLVVDALEGKDQAFWFGWGANVPYGLFHHNYLAPAANPTNWTRLDNPTVIADIQTLAGCTTQQCTLQATDSIDQVFDQQVPVIFLMSTVEGWPIDTSKVGGATLAPANSSGLDPELMWQYLWQK